MENKNVSNAEWNIMECLWEHAPRTSREIVDSLKESVGWSKSTTMTMLNRMTEKGIIACDDTQKVRLYTPCVDRDLAVKKETESFLKRVYKGSVSLMMSAMTKEQDLTDEEIEELYEILRKSKNK